MVTLCGAPGLRFITIGPKVILPNKLCAVIQRQLRRIHEIHPEMKVIGSSAGAALGQGQR